MAFHVSGSGASDVRSSNNRLLSDAPPLCSGAPQSHGLAHKNRMKMIARISTRLACSEDELWEKIIDPRSLQFVASPILSFVPVQEGSLTGEWLVGVPYQLNLYFLKFIPMGRHTIQLVRIDKEANTIISHERGLLARVWNHTIRFWEVTPGVLGYIDEIEIRAGWLTPAIFMFAQLFYRHRQRRWNFLLRMNNQRRKNANI